MLKKLLPVLMIALVWSAVPAQAQDGRRPAADLKPPAGNPIYQQRGAQGKCYTGLNGRGKVIEWARNKEQCRTQTTGQSWGHSGHYDNFWDRTGFRP